MKEHPITFNSEMVRAIITGRKTQTRRMPNERNAKWKVGDRLWVRKVWRICGLSIHTPKWASRITLEITGLRKENLLAISNKDIKAEGCPRIGNDVVDWCDTWFARLWNSCYTQEGQRWQDNPEVLVVEFRRVK